MNPKIMEILPKKIEVCQHQDINSKQLCYTCLVRNETLDEVTEALEKHDVCLCPSEGKLKNTIKQILLPSCTCNDGSGIICVGCFYRNDLAKAIRKLMMGDEK